MGVKSVALRMDKHRLKAATPAPAPYDSVCQSREDFEHLNMYVLQVNCTGAWGSFGSCSKSCGGGTRSQTYTISQGALHGGQACPHAVNAVNSEACNTNPCPVNCVGSFSAWGGCSVSCGTGGSQSQTYGVSTSANYGGLACPFSNGHVARRDCNTSPCPVSFINPAFMANTLFNMRPGPQ